MAYDELLKQLDLRAATWRSLLFAGFAPSLILVGSTSVASWGVSLTKDQLEQLVYWKATVDDFAWPVAGLVISTLLFAMLREPIFAFFRRIPIAHLHPFLLQRSAARRCRAELVKDRALWKISVARWDEVDFESTTFMPSHVRETLALPDEAIIRTKLEDMRRTICTAGGFSASKRKALRHALGWLYIMAADRSLVSEKAATLSETQHGRADTINWQEAEASLGRRVAGDWLEQELQAWRQVRAASSIARNRIGSLNRDELHDDYAAKYRAFQTYPSKDWVEATRLGNVMGALEDYGQSRYRVSTGVLWSRVEKVLPKSEREEVYGAQITMYSLLNCQAACILAMMVVLFQVLQGYMNPDLLKITPERAAIFMGCLVFAFVFSRFAAHAAGQLRYQMESRVDLYSPRWLASIGLVPKDTDERSKMIEALGAYLSGESRQAPNFPLIAITDPVLSFDKGK
jgi:hypothetical protein